MDRSQIEEQYKWDLTKIFKIVTSQWSVKSMKPELEKRELLRLSNEGGRLSTHSDRLVPWRDERTP